MHFGHVRSHRLLSDWFLLLVSSFAAPGLGVRRVDGGAVGKSVFTADMSVGEDGAPP
jgi:hypothetical protein